MQAERHTIHILRRGVPVEIPDFSPTETLLDYLRLREGAIGTKEGCAEGDCGACTVALGRPDAHGRIEYRPVNACIHLLGMADGAEVVTVEDLARDNALHPIQQAMVEHNASQCGFCTPGFVMALFALYHRAGHDELDRSAVNDAIAGNLCRCTGYRPIVDAALDACAAPKPDGFGGDGALADMRRGIEGKALFVGDERRFFAAPTTIDELAALCVLHPDATIVAGATDVGLWITKQMRSIERVIHVGQVAEMTEIEDDPEAIVIGAAVTYQQAWDALSSLDPDIEEVLRRLGSPQVRAAGTIGGNIANGSPIGDTPPLLIALGAEIMLRHGADFRVVTLEDFFLEYGKQDRKPGEFVESIRIPKLRRDTAFRAYKISKRFDQDISALLAAFAFDIEEGNIKNARIAFGGMAGIPKRATSAETALRGVSLAEPAGWAGAITALATDFRPVDDHRASAAYRLQIAGNLLRKALTEIAANTTSETRLHGIREMADG